MPSKFSRKRQNGNVRQVLAFSPMCTIFSSLRELMSTSKLNIAQKKGNQEKEDEQIQSRFQTSNIKHLLIRWKMRLTSVNSTLAGSPITVPSGCAYPAYLISWEFHTRKSLFGSFLCGKIVMTDLKFPPLVAHSKCFLRNSNISFGVVTLRASNTW